MKAEVENGATTKSRYKATIGDPSDGTTIRATFERESVRIVERSMGRFAS